MSKKDRQAKREEKRANRKPFKDTAVGIFLKEKAPDILGGAVSTVGDIFSIGGLDKIGQAIAGSNDLSPEDKVEAQRLLELEIEEQKELTKRWESDNKQELMLPKLIRPSILAYTWVLLSVLVVMDACGVSIDSVYIRVFEILALAVNSAYFGARTIEKYHRNKYK